MKIKLTDQAIKFYIPERLNIVLEMFIVLVVWYLLVIPLKNSALAVTTCTDTDGGNNYSVKGTTCQTTDGGSPVCSTDMVAFVDTYCPTPPCASPDFLCTLREYYCRPDQTKTSFTYNCQNCGDGTCINPINLPSSPSASPSRSPSASPSPSASNAVSPSPSVSPGIQPVLLVKPAGTNTGNCQSTPCQTIQYAVNQAPDNALIKVASGNYQLNNGESSVAVVIFAAAKNITISGSWDPNTWTKSTSNSVINGSVIGAPAPPSGRPDFYNIGGFNMGRGNCPGSPTPAPSCGPYNVTIEGFEVVNFGGNQSRPGILVSEFSGGTAFMPSYNFNIKNNLVHNGTTTGISANCFDACYTIERNRIYNITTPGAPAGIHVIGCGGVIKNNLIYNNIIPDSTSILKFGSAIDIATINYAPCAASGGTESTSLISQNTLDNNAGGMGAVLTYNGANSDNAFNVYMKNNLISNTKTVPTPSYWPMCPVNNLNTSSAIHLYNNWGWNNRDDHICCNYGSTGCIEEAGNNHTDTSPYANLGEYELRADALPVDAGANLTNEAPPNIRQVTNDFEAQNRPYGSAFDVGAFEYQPTMGIQSVVCKPDTNNDLVVNLGDINSVLNKFGQSCTGCKEDPNDDSAVNMGDINFILGYFGQACI